ncbi:MAG: hypothetical protein MJE68_23180 [Proteobacteria bacterium]|nr:hypothetical protein [Pseudomonadota bacterium]
MQQLQLIAALILLGATLAASLPVNSALMKDDSRFKAVETITDTNNASSTAPTATTIVPANDSESSVNTTQLSNHTWPSMEDPNLFEGDIKVSQEIIDKYYGKLKDEKEDSTNSTKVGQLLHIIIML